MSLLTANRWATVSVRLRSAWCRRRPRTLLSSAPRLHDRSRRSRATHFDPSQFVDHYEVAVVEMLNKKQAGMPVSREHATPRLQDAVNLMEVLRRSIAQEKAVSASPKKRRRRIERQGEMLLAIPGRKQMETVPKAAGRFRARLKSAG